MRVRLRVSLCLIRRQRHHADAIDDGGKDLRTPMEQTEQYYRALKLRKIPTAMIRLTDGWHSRSLPPTNFMRVQLYLRNWFERFMVTETQTTDQE